MLNTHEKINALAVFATGNSNALKSISEISETVRGMEVRLVKMTARQIYRVFINAIQYHPLEADPGVNYRFKVDHKSISQELSPEKNVELARHFLELGYIGGDIVCLERYNAGIMRYVYTFYFD